MYTIRLRNLAGRHDYQRRVVAKGRCTDGWALRASIAFCFCILGFAMGTEQWILVSTLDNTHTPSETESNDSEELAAPFERVSFAEMEFIDAFGDERSLQRDPLKAHFDSHVSRTPVPATDLVAAHNDSLDLIAYPPEEFAEFMNMYGSFNDFAVTSSVGFMGLPVDRQSSNAGIRKFNSYDVAGLSWDHNDLITEPFHVQPNCQLAADLPSEPPANVGFIPSLPTARSKESTSEASRRTEGIHQQGRTV